jgi:hypothetical protein
MCAHYIYKYCWERRNSATCNTMNEHGRPQVKSSKPGTERQILHDRA